jgi:hypothetical protein
MAGSRKGAGFEMTAIPQKPAKLLNSGEGERAARFYNVGE